jgi:hypothetical protein
MTNNQMTADNIPIFSEKFLDDHCKMCNEGENIRGVLKLAEEYVFPVVVHAFQIFEGFVWGCVDDPDHYVKDAPLNDMLVTIVGIDGFLHHIRVCTITAVSIRPPLKTLEEKLQNDENTK